ncbi:MAG: ATP-dependent DNA ligase [Cyanobacteria bacterium P01_A01_bin.105]
MKRFTQLFQAVDATTSTNEKVRALQHYFQGATAADAVWALYLFLGKTRKRLITSRILRDIFLQISDIPEWLFEDSYAHVGDSAETIALLLRDTPLPPVSAAGVNGDTPLHQWMEQVIPQVKPEVKREEKPGVESGAKSGANSGKNRASSRKTLEGEALRDLIVSWWANLEDYEIFVLNKILTGAFRVGASTKLVIKALAATYDLPEAVLAHRLMGDFTPTPQFYEQLIHPDTAAAEPSQPYPFFLAATIDEAKFAGETMADWQAEWKWDGIRAQMIHRAGQHFIWSRGEDLITPQFPEFEAALLALPEGTVLDGEIVCWDGQRPLDFNELQKRLGRKRVTAKVMAANPVHYLAYDLLEWQGEDIRPWPLAQRRQQLLAALAGAAAGDDSAGPEAHRISPSETVPFEQFADLQALRQTSRQQAAEGLMLKKRDSPYLVGRKRGYWWKYKVDPMTLDAVLIYAQAGSGKRANLFTDYTFALWQGEDLVTFAKAYSGLDNREIEKLDRWIRRHTRERFGPVRSVEPVQVFEIGFEGISESKRHKSGISVRFPRILRWRDDKPAEEADTLQTAMALLQQRQEKAE